MTEKNHQLTEAQKQTTLRFAGLILGIFSKALLMAGGCEVDFKINGEDISQLEKLHKMDISERIRLAIQEERYEDAAKLKKLLDSKNQASNL